MPRFVPQIPPRVSPVGAPAFPNCQVFTASGTFTVPAGVTTVYVSGCGAGGSGGRSDFPPGSGGGGGASVLRRPIAVTPGAGISVTIGAGGAVPAGNQPGNNGGSTSFGALLTLPGGGGGTINGGAQNNGGATLAARLSHPQIVGGDEAALTSLAVVGVLIAGQSGMVGSVSPTNVGRGGASYFSSLASDEPRSVVPGNTPLGPGAGGGGGSVTDPSAAGANGILIVEW